MNRVFISHTHGDQPIADALSDLLTSLFGDTFNINYSSKEELKGGIAPGEDWQRWIGTQVKDTDVALLVLTPNSIQKPWVLWEAGAVAGAIAARVTDDRARKIYPVVYELKSNEIPDPFRRLQVVLGTDQKEMTKLVEDLTNLVEDDFSRADMRKIGVKMGECILTYLTTMKEVVLKLPLVVTEDSVQEWLSRLGELQKEGRFTEAGVLENWLNIAFGRDEKDRARPLDLRLHRQLGEIYALGQQPHDATRQFELARQLAPRDIFLLRRLGKAYLDQGAKAEAEKVLERIAEFDPKAFERNAETAALKARWYRENGDRLGERDVLKQAYGNNPSSYYLGDLLGQVQLDLDETDEARLTYRQVLQTLEKLPDQNVWTAATALTAVIVLADKEQRIDQQTRELRRLRPSREQLASIERGLGRVIERIGADPSILQRLRQSPHDE